MIEVQHLTKRYGSHTAVDDLSFTAEPGKIYGFLGPNGAGKSTTMNMMTGYLAPSEGTILYDGTDIQKEPEKAKKKIGYLPETAPVYTDMTVREYLHFAAELKRIRRQEREEAVRNALDAAGLWEVPDRLIRNLSKGYRQRVGLSQALLGNPDILILDEPTNGLDPSGIHEIRNLVKSLPSLYDCTVLISSHMLSEIELIADDIGILNHGRLLFEGSMNDLRQYALQSGFAADNLEDVFLSMVEKDNMDRKQRAKL